MPGLVRKLLIFAAVDGLILQPAPPRNHPPATQQAIKIDYKGAIQPLLRDRRDEETTPQALEAHGIVGLLQAAKSTFLIAISRRELVAQVRGRAIYVITDVALIPLASQAEANNAITQARESVKRYRGSDASGDDSESESDTDTDTDTESDHFTVDESLPDTPPQDAEKDATTATAKGRRTSVAEDVIGRKGVYGRFAQKWFSKKGWSAEGRRMQGMSSDEDVSKQPKSRSPAPAPQDDPAAAAATAAGPVSPPASGSDATVKPTQDVSENLPQPANNNTGTLLPKILKTTKLYFSSRSFFFSYDLDLSRSWGNQTEAHSSLPLFKLYDSLFFWNKNIIEPFIEAGQYSFVLPVIQGFVGQRVFSVDVAAESSGSTVVGAASEPEEVVAAQESAAAKRSTSPPPPSRSNTKSGLSHPQVTPLSVHSSTKKDYVITLISRRSVMRAGLRYLRRGVDEDGHAANSVETEQILAPQSWDSTDGKIYSFVQFRGSIPLFFSQSPYSLKPIPQLWGSPDTNATAFKLHFSQLAARYGGIQAASLVDKHGTEQKIGAAYEEYANALNEDGGIDGRGMLLGFEWFDFHSVCRGMKFENVALLMNSLAKNMKNYGWTVEDRGQIVQMQSGILRTNCMDCLDRTNVVQSACAREALERQLADQNVSIDLQHDPRTSWFNTLWADNGDAISKQYAGTAALKGDFTRTRKRNIAGALTDFGLTLSRYYNNIVNDYFAQAVIDYLLGRATEDIFADFEDDMKSQDYAIDLRKVRQLAISRCAELVIEDPQEDFLHGWTLSCPAKSSSLRALPFEECVLLLTERALYFCRFDWGTEKVREFERIELEDVKGLAKGTYITSTLAPRHMDEAKNVGFVVEYVHIGPNLVRVNTRSLATEKSESEAQAEAEANPESEAKPEAEAKLEAEKKDADEELREQTKEQSESGKAQASSEAEDQRSNEDASAAKETNQILPLPLKKKTTTMKTDPSLPPGAEKRFLAFKALPPKSSFATTGGSNEADAEPPSERELVSMICEEIKRAKLQRAKFHQESEIGRGRDATAKGKDVDREDDALQIEDRDIVSLADAKKSTGLMEQIGYSLKKLVWA
ncbi:Phosphatidylinositide phosphatase SAC2 [Lasiodiplodia hormozganensis]|uniref:Phosphatidylinositide phosphatase SAC2 n=1 Tax=Lasiodiplodia hormozganensis TaxID=869390 RepID=A0AA39YTB9_9PEZI|nr:Phosphatidylinositide phosphatase SAC2 [Lasiodiplodia hormozganensis]